MRYCGECKSFRILSADEEVGVCEADENTILVVTMDDACRSEGVEADGTD